MFEIALRRRQQGATLIAAIALVTVLALLATAMTRFTQLDSEQTVNEVLSARALYAAESGVDWQLHQLVNGGSATRTNEPIESGLDIWFSTEVASVAFGSRVKYSITSTGKAGESAATPRVQRQIKAEFIP